MYIYIYHRNHINHKQAFIAAIQHPASSPRRSAISGAVCPTFNTYLANLSKIRQLDTDSLWIVSIQVLHPDFFCWAKQNLGSPNKQWNNRQNTSHHSMPAPLALLQHPRFEHFVAFTGLHFSEQISWASPGLSWRDSHAQLIVSANRAAILVTWWKEPHERPTLCKHVRIGSWKPDNCLSTCTYWPIGMVHSTHRRIFFFTPLRGHKRVIRAIFAPGTDGATAHAADSQSQRRRHMAFL